MFCVYQFINKKNNKKYIGKTKDFNERLNEHLYHAKSGSHLPFHRALKKYGIDGFTYDIIEYFDAEEDSFKSEIKWIDYHKTNIYKHGNSFGYNLTDGGDGVSGLIMSEESKQKMSKAHEIFSDSEVLSILEDYKNGHDSTITLAEKYNCSPTTIYFIVSNIRYRHLNYDFSNFDEIKYKNKHKKGENNSAAKFSNNTVIDILNEYSSGGVSTRQLSKKYNCSAKVIELILTGKSYGYIEYDRNHIEKIKKLNVLNKRNKVKGELNGSAKLSNEDVINIRKMCSEEMLVKDIAKLFKVHRLTIGRIKNNLTRK